MGIINEIFNIETEEQFKTATIKVFQYQYTQNKVYHNFCNLLGKTPEMVKNIDQIPFLPIEFFKTTKVICGEFKPEQVFLSSGTTGTTQSKHFVKELAIYEQSFFNSFYQFYGDIEDYCVLALLPSYMEREGSSLIYMTEQLIEKSKHELSGFYLDEYDLLIKNLTTLKSQNQKTILIGVSFALLDLAEKYQLDLSGVIIMETGGMKGRRKELTRKELHQIYQERFNVENIHSEYGMTELLSQAYSKGGGVYHCPKWMSVLIRDVNDPFHLLGINKTGGVNVIDLANLHSCSFIATQDLGKKNNENSFEILGRFDNSDLRGCNLLIE